MYMISKKYKYVLALKELTEGRYLHEQYDNPLRISHLEVLNEFIVNLLTVNGLNKYIKKYKELVNNLFEKDYDQTDVFN